MDAWHVGTGEPAIPHDRQAIEAEEPRVALGMPGPHHGRDAIATPRETGGRARQRGTPRILRQGVEHGNACARKIRIAIRPPADDLHGLTSGADRKRSTRQATSIGADLARRPTRGELTMQSPICVFVRISSGGHSSSCGPRQRVSCRGQYGGRPRRANSSMRFAGRFLSNARLRGRSSGADIRGSILWTPASKTQLRERPPRGTSARPTRKDCLRRATRGDDLQGNLAQYRSHRDVDGPAAARYRASARPPPPPPRWPVRLWPPRRLR